MAKANASQSALHKPVKNEHALLALFMALAAFFFTFNSVVETDRTAASASEQVIVAE
jgi:hypothetical protein